MVLSANNPRALSRAAAAIARTRSDDRGVMIIEVLVSAVLLIVISLATLAVIDRSGEVSGMNRARSVATALGQKDQDAVRQTPWAKVSSYFNGLDLATNPSVDLYAAEPDHKLKVSIDGRDYLVKTTLSLVSDTNNVTACLANWKNKRVRIRTEVEPPPGHRMKPVVMETYRVPSITDKQDKGSVIVKLSQANGKGTPDVPVNVTGASEKKTDADGCVVFNDLDAGNGKVVSWGKESVNGDGGGQWVDENGATLVKRYLTISAGVTAQMSGRFDKKVSLSLSLEGTNPDGATVAGEWNAMSVVNSGITTVYNGVRSWLPTAPDPLPNPAPSATDQLPTQKQAWTLSNLFPFESSYGVFAGDCWGNNPDVWGGDPTPNNAILMDTTKSSVSIPVPVVRFRFPAGAGYRAFLSLDRRVDKQGTGRCAVGAGIWPPGMPLASRYTNEAQRFKTTTATNSVIDYAVPYGVYRVCVDNGGIASGTKRKLKGSAKVRVDNVPANTPFYTEGRFKDFSAGAFIPSGSEWEDGTCSAESPPGSGKWANNDAWSSVDPINP